MTLMGMSSSRAVIGARFQASCFVRRSPTISLPMVRMPAVSRVISVHSLVAENEGCRLWTGFA